MPALLTRTSTRSLRWSSRAAQAATDSSEATSDLSGKTSSPAFDRPWAASEAAVASLPVKMIRIPWRPSCRQTSSPIPRFAPVTSAVRRDMRLTYREERAAAARGAPEGADAQGRNDPTGIRTPVTALKGPCPGPLDDGVGSAGNYPRPRCLSKDPAGPRERSHDALALRLRPRGAGPTLRVSGLVTIGRAAPLPDPLPASRGEGDKTRARSWACSAMAEPSSARRRRAQQAQGR